MPVMIAPAAVSVPNFGTSGIPSTKRSGSSRTPSLTSIGERSLSRGCNGAATKGLAGAGRMILITNATAEHARVELKAQSQYLVLNQSPPRALTFKILESAGESRPYAGKNAPKNRT